jgi:transcriptional antiterminator NusG
MNRMEAEAPKVKFNFQPGEKVRIRSGPFSDFIGTVAEIDIERAKVRVMVSFFGRETPVELDFLHVEKISSFDNHVSVGDLLLKTEKWSLLNY